VSRGAVIAGYLAERISRKWTLIASGVVYVLGALGCAFAGNVPTLVAFRFILGLAVGTASFVGPMYISEMAPPRIRGGLTSFNQLAIVRSSAMSASTVGNWAANFLVSFTFLTLVATISRPGMFFPYAGINLLALVFFLPMVPETTGRSLEQLQRELTPSRSESRPESRPESRAGSRPRPQAS
jgi:MFS family permease